MKIKVIELPSKNDLGRATDGELDMVRHNGIIINCGGRSLPF